MLSTSCPALGSLSLGTENVVTLGATFVKRINDMIAQKDCGLTLVAMASEGFSSNHERFIAGDYIIGGQK